MELINEVCLPNIGASIKYLTSLNNLLEILSRSSIRRRLVSRLSSEDLTKLFYLISDLHSHLLELEEITIHLDVIRKFLTKERRDPDEWASDIHEIAGVFNYFTVRLKKYADMGDKVLSYLRISPTPRVPPGPPEDFSDPKIVCARFRQVATQVWSLSGWNLTEWPQKSWWNKLKESCGCHGSPSIF